MAEAAGLATGQDRQQRLALQAITIDNLILSVVSLLSQAAARYAKASLFWLGFFARGPHRGVSKIIGLLPEVASPRSPFGFLGCLAS